MPQHESPDPRGLTHEQLEEASAQTGIASTAYRFLKSFYTDGNLAVAWLDTDPLLRLCWAQWWVHANGRALTAAGHDLEETANDLALRREACPLWNAFQRVVLRDFRAAHPLDVARSGIGASPRLIAPDVEVVYIHRSVPKSGVWAAGASSSVVPMVLHLNGSDWQVLNLGYERIPKLGWPPTLA